MSSLEHVIRLKEALECQKNGSIPGDIANFQYTTNRGHKLEPGARFVSSRTLNIPDLLNHDIVKSSLDEGEQDEIKDELEINPSEILQPIMFPAQLVTHPAMKEVFMSPFINQLSRELLDVIVNEKKKLSEISDLFMSFLGDDERLILPKVAEYIDEQNINNENYKPNPDVFFEVPEPEIDKNMGLEKEEADELRRKLLVSQHLMMEYVRGLTEIRSGLEKAKKMRYDVLNWCRELNNEDYIKIDLDHQNNNDNAGLGERPAKDFQQEYMHY